MKRMLALLLLMVCCVLTGCMSRQLEEQMLVIILGVDETEEGIRLVLKIPSNSASGDSGGDNTSGEDDAMSGGGQMGYLLLEATGGSFEDTMTLLHATTPRTLNFCQVREVVVGEKLASGDQFAALIAKIYMLPRMRSQAIMVISRGEAREFVAAQKPYVGIRLSRYVDTTISNYAGKGFIPTVTLGQAHRDLGMGFVDPLLVYGAVNRFDQPEYEKMPIDSLPGNLPRKSVNKVEMLGAAATDGVGVSGELTGYEMALVHLLRGDVEDLNIDNRDDPSARISARSPATLRVDLSTRPATLSVQLLCVARYAPGLAPDAEAVRRRVETDIAQMLRKLQQMRCDGVGFGNIAVRQCMTMAQWDALNWRDTYSEADVQVEVRLQLREN